MKRSIFEYFRSARSIHLQSPMITAKLKVKCKIVIWASCSLVYIKENQLWLSLNEWSFVSLLKCAYGERAATAAKRNGKTANWSVIDHVTAIICGKKQVLSIKRCLVTFFYNINIYGVQQVLCCAVSDYIKVTLLSWQCQAQQRH